MSVSRIPRKTSEDRLVSPRDNTSRDEEIENLKRNSEPRHSRSSCRSEDIEEGMPTGSGSTNRFGFRRGSKNYSHVQSRVDSGRKERRKSSTSKSQEIEVNQEEEQEIVEDTKECQEEVQVEPEVEETLDSLKEQLAEKDAEIDRLKKVIEETGIDSKQPEELPVENGHIEIPEEPIEELPKSTEEEPKEGHLESQSATSMDAGDKQEEHKKKSRPRKNDYSHVKSKLYVSGMISRSRDPARSVSKPKDAEQEKKEEKIEKTAGKSPRPSSAKTPRNASRDKSNHSLKATVENKKGEKPKERVKTGVKEKGKGSKSKGISEKKQTSIDKNTAEESSKTQDNGIEASKTDAETEVATPSDQIENGTATEMKTGNEDNVLDTDKDEQNTDLQDQALETSQATNEEKQKEDVLPDANDKEEKTSDQSQTEQEETADDTGN